MYFAVFNESAARSLFLHFYIIHLFAEKAKQIQQLFLHQPSVKATESVSPSSHTHTHTEASLGPPSCR